MIKKHVNCLRSVRTASRFLLPTLVCPIIALVIVNPSSADTFRYRLSGDWQTITDGTSEGWGLDPNNSGAPGTSLPGGNDDARINWGGNTVSVNTTVPTVNRVQIGVDESGTLEVNNGGALTTSGSNGDVLAGNNNANATGTLIVNNGGTVDVGRILWAANNGSDGVININGGGQVTVASHLWWGVTGTAAIDISGTLQQTGGILGMGTSNASTPSGGTATVNVLDGGLLALNNIQADGSLASIQPGSLLNIADGGLVTLPGDFVPQVTPYITAGRIAGNGVAGAAQAVFDSGMNQTLITAIPEPSTFALLTLMGAGLAMCRLGRRGWN